MATEIAIFELKNGTDPRDPNSDAAKLLEESLKKVLQQPGAQRAYWGIEEENKENLHLFVDWDNVEDHRTFMKSEIYQPFLNQFGEMVDLSKTQMYHANLKPHPPSAVLSKSTSPATEILVVYFPSNYSAADQEQFDKNVNLLFQAVEKHAPASYTASAGGWIIEELTIPGKEEKAKAYSAQIGWQSVKHHLDFRTTEAFKEHIHLLRGAKDLKHLTVCHYHGNEVGK